MSRATCVAEQQGRGFPRVSGDEPPVGGEYWAVRTFSPRERG